MRQETNPNNPPTGDDALTAEMRPTTSKRRYWVHRATTMGVALLRPWPEMRSMLDVCQPGSVHYVPQLPRSSALVEWVGADSEVELFLDGHEPTLRYRGRTLTSAAAWFGDIPNTAWATVQAAEAIEWVNAQLVRRWRDDGVRCLATPGTTGRDLWLRTTAAEGCPVMSSAAQTMVRATSAQGRVETFPPRADTLPALYEYDMRVAYAAVLRGLPMGEPELVGSMSHEDIFVEARRCRLHVVARAPRWWAHVGLLSKRGEDGSLSWPADGEAFRTWADGAEVALALRMGWKIEVLSGLVWPRTGDPLRTWSERLLSMLTEADRTLIPERFQLVRSMVRAIILHTVGAFHGAPHRVTRRAESLDLAPIGAPMLRVHDDGSVSWREMAPPAWPEASHPEWSAHIWARNRVRLLVHPSGGGMLTVPPEVLVAVRTDAVYTSSPVGWEQTDNGRVGQWVLKYSDTEPAPWPADGLDVLHRKGGE